LLLVVAVALVAMRMTVVHVSGSITSSINIAIKEESSKFDFDVT